jgi:hypothetical protein
MSIATSTSIATFTGRRLIAPVTAPIGLAMAVDTAQAAAVIVPAAAAITAAATEAAAGTGAEVAGATADRPDRDRLRRTAVLIVARQADGL